MQVLLLLLALLVFAPFEHPAAATLPGGAQSPTSGGVDPDPALPSGLDHEAEIDLRCLRESYPVITGYEKTADGKIWLLFTNGHRVLYQGTAGDAGQNSDPWSVDVRGSMAQPYPLDPVRVDTPLGVSPGRHRSYAFMNELYGDSPQAVIAQTSNVSLLHRSMQLSRPAAQAFNTVKDEVERHAGTPHIARFLKLDGGYYWRTIAGTNRLSPHSYGIAFDISPNIATYWQWSKLRPHPLQRDYPTEIVQAFEKAGFIWGGKWHEYDMMHFEYRPEIICKARLREKTQR